MIGRLRLIISLGLGLLIIFSACTSKDESTTLIKIDGGDFQEFNVADLLKGASIIQLETSPTCILGDGVEFLNHTDGFYVLDKDEYSCVLHFDEHGSFVKSVGRKGKGRGEYVRLYDAIVTDEGIELLGGYPKAEVFYYNHEGEFIKKESLNEYINYSFVYQPEAENYFFYSANRTHKVLQLSKDLLVRQDSMLVTSGGTILGQPHPFTPNRQGGYLFHEFYCDTIFEIENNSARVKYLLDLGEIVINPSIPYQELSEVLSKGGYWVVDKLLDNRDYLYLHAIKAISMEEQAEYHLLYKKKTKEIFKLPENDSFSSSLALAFHFNNSNELYFSLSPFKALESDVWVEFFESKEIDVKEDDNPIVVKIQL